MIEIWKDIEGYEDRYQVSNFGNVKSLNYNHTGKERLLKQSVINKKQNYLVVTLYNKVGAKKRYYVHTLVAKAFIPNPDNLPEVNHKTEDPKRNEAWNLEWCDRLYNSRYGTGSQRSGDARGKTVRCVETGVVYPSVSKAARETKINKTSIRYCASGTQKTAGGYRWEFIDKEDN